MSRKVLRRWLVTGVTAAVVAISALCPIPTHAQEEEGRKVRTRVAPEYPELARRMHLNGTVKLQVVVMAAGTAKSAKAVGGNPVFIDAALEAVKKWRWEPGPAETVEVVEFHFVVPS